MGTPYHISRSISQRYGDKESAEFQALSLIAESLAHPDRTLLCAFVQQATDRELASRFFLDEVAGRDEVDISKFLAKWICLLHKVRPTVSKDTDPSLERIIRQRDGDRCCVSIAHGKKHNERPILVHILSPTLFLYGDMAQDGKLYKMLAMHLGEAKMRYLISLSNQDAQCPGQGMARQLMLLSPRMFEHYRNGRFSLKSSPFAAAETSAQYFSKKYNFIPFVRAEVDVIVTFENRAAGLASLPDSQLIDLHDQLAPALGWLEVLDEMRHKRHLSYNSKSHGSAGCTEEALGTKVWLQRCTQSASRVFEYIWTRLPVFIRAFTYKHLALLGQSIYGSSGSDRTYRLPFNLYLRMAPRQWASKHEVELQSLKLVGEYTQIPAPRGIDVIQYSDSSYLLMTSVPGQCIGQILSIMTDEQVDTVVKDLEKHLAQLRQIPKKTGSKTQICNSVGGGILDWRIGESQRKELVFQNETDFNQFLTYDLPLDEDAWTQISRSHSVKHEIVFTHADLNLRNILVNENNKISGIVDWECAGWYPEYWECSKMHFGVRLTHRWIGDVIDQLFSTYHDEVQVENMLSSMHPQW